MVSNFMRKSILAFFLCGYFPATAFAQAEVCPQNYEYIFHQAGKNFCISAMQVTCKPKQYVCGTDGKSCCPIGEDNNCPAGFQACKPAGTNVLYGNSKPLCCKSAAKPKKPPVVKKEPPKPQVRFYGAVKLLCKSGIGTGSSEFNGFSASSCADAYSKAEAEANRVGCKYLGSNYSRYGIERIKTGTCINAK